MYTDKIAVIGLGYVGLPLAIAMAGKYRVKGFDIDKKRIEDLTAAFDYTHEAEMGQLKALLKSYESDPNASGIFFTDDVNELKGANIYIVAVPTPVDAANQPDLSLLKKATLTVASVLKRGDIVIYESTVFPGCTEEFAAPLLEKCSGLTFNVDFFCGYSPERINPGDKSRTIYGIQKITSGSTPEAAGRVDSLYASIITAGTYKAPSIKVAEAAKVIENTQRDVNIAFVNELAKIFAVLKIDTNEVLKAAATKWNFLPFQPGLVGGHCIGVDPYYLAEKAITVGYRPAMILAARSINDSMGKYVAERMIILMKAKQVFHAGAEVLIMGITFKENFPDVRNSRVVDIVGVLVENSLAPVIFDPVASPEDVSAAYQLKSLIELPAGKRFAGIIVAVSHSQFMTMDYASLLQNPGALFDVKGTLTSNLVDERL